MAAVQTSDFDAAEIEAAIEASKGGNNTPPAEQQQNNTPPPADEKPPAEGEKPAGTVPNPFELLSTLSEGLIKDEDSFKAVLPKVKGYDTLELQLKDLQTKVPNFKNEETRQWFDLVQSDEGIKAFKDYFAEKDKDYSTMSDLDVRREALSKEHPQWSKKDVDLELRHKYGGNLELKDLSGFDKDDDPDGYAEAVNHNKEVEKNLELLAVHARDDRYSLLEKQKLIELPKINKAGTTAQQPAALTKDEIAANAAKWNKAVDEDLPKLEDIKLSIDDKEVVYAQTDDEKKQLAEKVKSFTWPGFIHSRGWVNDDGTSNPLKIAADLQKLYDFDKIGKAIGTQMKTETTKELLKKIKNVDDKSPAAADGLVFDTLDEAFRAAKYK